MPGPASPHNRDTPPNKRHSGHKVPKPLTQLNRRGVQIRSGHKKTGSVGSAGSNEGNEEHMMSTSFQQFCSTCDKQIVVPDASILYCSERCRQQDSSSHSLPLFKTDVFPSPSPYPSSTFNAQPIPDIIPQRSPTSPFSARRPSAFPQSPSERSPLEMDIPSTSVTGRLRRPSSIRTDSEAARYLAQFGDPARHKHSTSSNPTPPLSYTPSSYTSNTILSTPHQSLTHSLRPLNPRWSSTFFASRSVDLITPLSHSMGIANLTDADSERSKELSRCAEEDTSYEKRPSLESAAVSSARGSLKEMFCFEQMRSQPAPTQIARKRGDSGISSHMIEAREA